MQVTAPVAVLVLPGILQLVLGMALNPQIFKNGTVFGDTKIMMASEPIRHPQGDRNTVIIARKLYLCDGDDNDAGESNSDVEDCSQIDPENGNEKDAFLNQLHQAQDENRNRDSPDLEKGVSLQDL